MISKYNVLIIGSGAREHAFAWKIKQSSRINKLFVAPGNAGTSEIAENILLSVNDFEAIKSAVLKNDINMVLVGPEDPIVNGITDFFENEDQLKNILIIAPGKSGARLEGSKSFSKQFMVKYNIPTAKYHIVTEHSLDEGIAFLSTFNPPYVLKADGLASGKGVLIIHDRNEAIISLKEILAGKFGEAGKTVVIEQFLEGIEMSTFVLTDGHNYVLLPEAKDYKRIGEGDTGLNTGGMGAVSPVPFLNPELQKKIDTLVIHRTIHGLRAENITFKGFIFIGLMISNNNPYVIEYNIRMGDPETEVVIPRIANDFVDLLEATALKKLDQQHIEIKKETFATIIAASKGYPEHFEKGKIISGLKNETESLVFHSGTTFNNNDILTNGGRVLAVSSSGKDIQSAVNTSVNTLQKIKFDGIYFRKDIGYEFI